MTQRTERFALALGLAITIFIGVRPYLANLDVPPMTTDGVLWVVRSAPPQPESPDGPTGSNRSDSPGWSGWTTWNDWSDWAFRAQHFGVGHRPVTAISYTLDHLVGGLAPFAYRATDLGLFALAGLLVYALFRALARGLPRWAGLVAVGAFMLHPSAEYVVPILARRSYLLGVVFSLAALVVFAVSLSARRGTRAFGGAQLGGAQLGTGALLCLAILSNEVSVVTLGLLPLIAVREADCAPNRWRSALRACAVPGALALLAILYRVWVVGGVGGYDLQDPLANSALSVFAASWHSLVPWLGTQDTRALVVTVGFIALVLPFYAWRAVAAPFFALRSPASQRTLVLVAWLLGTALLYAVLGVWWRRLAFFMLPPFALLVGSLLGASSGEARVGKLARVASVLPQVALLGLIVFHSPALRGQSPEWLGQTQRSGALIDALRRDSSSLTEPARVLTVLPVEGLKALKRDGIAPLLWADATLDTRDVSLEGLVFYERTESGALPRVERSGASHRLLLPKGRAYFVSSREIPGVVSPQQGRGAAFSRDHPEREFVPLRLNARRSGSGRAIDLNTLELPPGKRAYVYVYDGSVGTLTPLR